MIAANEKPPVNPVRRLSDNRVRVAAAFWLIASLIASIAADRIGAPRWAFGVGFAVAALPGLAGLIMLNSAFRESVFFAPVLVFSWTAAALVSVTATGGAGSPLMAAFLLAPLAALSVGARRTAFE
ncbi:MAG: hypothetical protein AAFQ67_03505, partial [Pseudomonadota bacterium]